MTATAAELASLTWGGYSRISDDQTDERAGVTRQAEDIIDAIAALGAVAPAEDSEHMVVENDTGAFKRRKVTITDHYGETRTAYRVVRPRWAEALRMLRNGQINALMVYDLDRLARDPYDLEDAIEAVEHYGAVIRSATASEIDLSTESGRMAARIMVVMANKASADTARRVARSHLDRARKGTAVGGVRPFGYEKDKCTPRASEAALIREAAEQLVVGVSLRSIAREWTDRGVATITGKPWHPNVVRNILANPRLAGWRVHQGKVALDKSGQPVRLRYPATTTVVVGDQVTEEPHPKAGEPTPPILDQDTYDRVMEVLRAPSRRGRKAARQGSRKYLLTGLLRCGICNGLMYGNAYDRHQVEKRFRYVCNGKAGTFGAHTISIAGLAVESYVEGLFLARLGSEEFDTAPASFDGSERLEQVKSSIAELMEAFRAGRLSAGIVFPQVEQLEAERDALEAERKAFIRATAGPRLEAITPESWEAMSVERKQAHLAQELDAILIKPPAAGSRGGPRLDPERIVPVWRG